MTSNGGPKPVFWSEAAMRRASAAVRENYASADCMIIARRVLEAAIRNQKDLHELFPKIASEEHA